MSIKCIYTSFFAAPWNRKAVLVFLYYWWNWWMDSHHQPRAKAPGFSALQRRVDATHQNSEGMAVSNSKSPFLLVCDANLHVPVQEHSPEILGGEGSGFQEAMWLWCELAVTMATTGLMSTGGRRRAPRKKSKC